MTIYNFNLGIGWASSGVEYAQLYRSQIFEAIKQPAKFIFLDFIGSDTVQHLTKNLGFRDEDVIWIYQYFTDFPIQEATFNFTNLESLFEYKFSRVEDHDRFRRYFFDEQDIFITAYKAKKNKNIVERAEYVSQGKLIRKDFYTSKRFFSEYYTPREKRAYLYERHFFNMDGSLAYEEIIDGDSSIFRIDNQILYSKAEFVAYFVTSLNLREKDLVIVDRSTGVGQAIFQNILPAKLAVAVHAEHYNRSFKSDSNILWNNYYEYQFDEAEHVDLYITATQKQKEQLASHFTRYMGCSPRIEVIPVGSLETLTFPDEQRERYGLVSASRLASEKHLDWLVEATVLAQKSIPRLHLDIYGSGGEKQKIETIIQKHAAENYIKLKGHQNLKDIYKKYTAYISASTSEGFGLTLMEAVGSGLAMVGLDVPYGNQTFIVDGENGYLAQYDTSDSRKKIINELSKKIVQIFENNSDGFFHKNSYQKARMYLADEVAHSWESVIEDVLDD